MDDITIEQLHQKFHGRDWDGLAQIFGRFDLSGTCGEGSEDKEGNRRLKEMLFCHDRIFGCNSLQLAGWSDAPVEIVSNNIDIGGRDIILDRHNRGRTSPLHCSAPSWNVDVLSKLIKICGRDSAFEISLDGKNSLQHTCSRGVSYGVASELTKIGGKDLQFPCCSKNLSL